MIDVDATPVAWREARPDGSPRGVVVLLHGLGGSRTTWDRVLPGLAADGWRAVAWDMPGYGASPHPDSPLSFGGLADAVVALVDRLGGPRAHLVGHSLGGMIALHTALDHPGHVDRLVLVDSSPAFGFDGTTDAATWKAARLDALDRGETPATIAHAVLRAVAGPSITDDALAEAVGAMSRIDPAGLRSAIEVLVTHDVSDELARITAPTLVLVGRDDEETPPAYARYLADRIADATGVELPGAGHMTPHECPEALTAMVRRFLRADRMEP